MVKLTSLGRRSVNTDNMTTVEIEYQLGEIQPTKITRYGGIVVSKEVELTSSPSIGVFACNCLLLFALL